MTGFHTLFVRVYLILFIIAMIGFLLIDHGNLVMWVNSHRSSWQDLSMPYLTHIGDGIFYGILALILIFYRWRLGLFFAICGLVQGLVSAFLKRLVFGKVPRPASYFEMQGIQLNYIEGVDLARWFAFPSGHTMTAFMMTALISLTILKKNPTGQFIVLIIALVVAYSRIYLLQHFYRDVVAGSFVGVFLAIVLIAFILPRMKNLKQGG